MKFNFLHVSNATHQGDLPIYKNILHCTRYLNVISILESCCRGSIISSFWWNSAPSKISDFFSFLHSHVPQGTCQCCSFLCTLCHNALHFGSHWNNISRTWGNPKNYSHRLQIRDWSVQILLEGSESCGGESCSFVTCGQGHTFQWASIFNKRLHSVGGKETWWCHATDQEVLCTEAKGIEVLDYEAILLCLSSFLTSPYIILCR